MKKYLTSVLLLCCLTTSVLAQSPHELSEAPVATTAAEEEQSEDNQLLTGEINKQIALEEQHKTGIYWAAPDYSKQEGVLGWTPNIFDVPPGFRQRVEFWIDIYSKYSTKQALLHDAKYMDIVYKTLDFSDLDGDERAKKKRIKDEKNKIREQLTRIQKLQDNPSKLSEEDQIVFKKFRFITEKNKFSAASARNRLRMQLGQKDRFLLGIYFSGRYIREMEKIFREENVPIELTRLPFVESSFNLYAYSRVGASGIWQFMRSTGKLFKLKIDPIRDLRNDPLTATRAAAKLLASNYRMLGNWSFALTGYNHGPQGVSRIAKKLQSDDINEIVWNSTGRRFGFASENFYACFLAALVVEKNAAKYFGKVDISPPLVYDEIEIPRPLTFPELAYGFKTDSDDGVERARLYNPYFTRPVLVGARRIPAENGFKIRIPKGHTEKFLSALKNVEPQKALIAVSQGLYKVIPGDTLSSISKDMGVSIQKLLKANNMSRNSVLRPGQKLVLPTGDER
ncbi:MAG: transglycosylase SLT domain-containing protein [Oligoflexia bacterium]|nr:transglycosylase SLT domain-containing protein [Oligoflexia bacterium]